MQDISIEPLARGDTDGFSQMLAIYTQSIEASEQKPPAVVKALLTDERYIVLVARKGNSVIGFAMLFFPPGGDLWLLEYMATSEDARSQGLGTELFRAAVSAASRRAPDAVCVLEVDEPSGAVSAHNDPIARLRFYARQGCRRIAGLNYILPLETAGMPPPMMLLVHGLDGEDAIDRERVHRWLLTLYRDVYSRPADDPRIDTMMSSAEASFKLVAIGQC